MLCECFLPASHPPPCEDESADELVITPRPGNINGGEFTYRPVYPLPRWETVTEDEIDSMLDEVL